MTDKLYCPICEYELRQVGAMHMCMEFSCCLCGVQIETGCMKELCKKFDVLQKKLDKAMAVLSEQVSALEMTGYGQRAKLLSDTIKEIEDIKG